MAHASQTTKQKRAQGSGRLTLRSTAHSLALFFALVITGCDGCTKTNAATSVCDPECPQGFACNDQSQCVSVGLPLVGATERGFPGRSVKLARTGEQNVQVALLDPEELRLLVGSSSGELPNQMFLLSEDVRRGTNHIAMAVGSSTVSIAWVGESGFYNLATRALDPQAAWGIERVTFTADPAPNYGATDDFDLVLDTANNPSMVFRDRRSNTLVYAQRSRESVGVWTRRVVDDNVLREPLCNAQIRQERGEGVGYGPVLVDTTQGLSVVYHDADCGDLRFAQRTASGEWQVDILDNGGDTFAGERVTGKRPSAVVGEDGVVWISYQDVTRAQLVVASLDGGRFTTSVADNGEDFTLESQRRKKVVGAYSKIAINEQGEPRVAYFDGTNTSLMVATQASGNTNQWTARVIDASGVVGLTPEQVQLDSGLWLTATERLVLMPSGWASRLNFYVTQE